MNDILIRLAAIKAEAEALRSSEDVDRLTKLQTLIDERRSLEAKLEEEKAFAEATADVPVAEGEAPAEEEAPAEAPAEEEAPAEAPAEEEAPAEAPAEARKPFALAASAADPVDNDRPDEHRAIVATVLASGNVAGTNPGSPITSREMERIHRHAGRVDPGTSGEATSIFASINTGFDGARVTDQTSAEGNSAIMASAGYGAPAITAALAFCGPDDIVLDICTSGVAERPVQGLFRTVGVRGPFRYLQSASFADVTPGVAIWSEADQLALDPDDVATWKPCVDLSCAAEKVVTPYAVTACSTIGVWQQLSAPEQVSNWLTKLEQQYARTAEVQLLDEIRATSHVFSLGASTLGPWNVLQAVLAHVKAIVGAAVRDTTEGYIVAAPYGFLAALAADEGLRGFTQNIAVQRIQAILQENYGIRIVEIWETDSTVAASYRTGVTNLPAVGGAATPFALSTHSPDKYPLYVLNPDSYTAGSSDIVDAGYIRDGSLVRQNLVRYFWEGMEFLEKTCDPPTFTFEIESCPIGNATALIAGPSCEAGLL